ncbi:aminopeptidase n, putative [Theileria annulata]|uniref:Aminopeptidase n, putative n=1 Tax=Theileria annulata TaxID=5874 RepID=Q4UGX3_THEAN|nr:aminopeptidase n, putative [Theileria annulata]CAI73666.1 aminopeptidase n, putative [Theileria annulata]|eukprot:XP_954343.1 aminopeptidase n, putative [Theileria annulata]
MHNRSFIKLRRFSFLYKNQPFQNCLFTQYRLNFNNLARDSRTLVPVKEFISHFGTQSTVFTGKGVLEDKKVLDKREEYPKMSATETQTKTESETSTLTLKPVKKFVEIFRKDYRPPEFDVENVYLDFDLDDTQTRVRSKLLMRRRPNTLPGNLVLNGDELDCKFVSVDGVELKNVPVTGYTLDVDGNMTVPSSFLPKDDSRTFTVETHVTVNPKNNTKLVGLYKSSAAFCTQCEPHGFRRITYYLDRPDVLSSFRVRVQADKKLYPVLLSNGNKVDSGDLGTKHFAEFVDPFPKPCYLFALVAGNLASISTTFKTMSGRNVLVQLSSEPEDVGKLQWALESVVKAMKWDEEKYGREYDLDEFHVFAVRDFNFGAMENKGLNIFNTALLLADVNTTTDAEFVRILSVVGHEYFHNWTGNRVTCRDWFQLTLKEGLTVFREHQFCGDMSSTLSNRIREVQYLMSVQFPEDAGPMSHPIRPESYISMDNFYTPTVYDKGSFVIGMYESLLGADGFRKGMDLYFERHDLSAVTCDDFRNAMADANNKDLTQFERWYCQSGTPVVEVVRAERVGDRYKLVLKQYTPPTPKQPVKQPFHIPLRVGFIGKSTGGDLLGNVLVELKEEQQEFEFGPVTEDCVLSLNRGFSAPVKVKYDQPPEELLFLMLYDTDGLNRWNAAQSLATKVVLDLTKDPTAEVPKTYLEAFKKLLDSEMDHNEKGLCMSMPDVDILASKMKPYDPGLLFASLKKLKQELGRTFRPTFTEMYKSLTLREGQKDELTKEDMARRFLRNTVFSFLVSMRDMESVELALKHYKEAKVMNDKYAAFVQLMHMDFQDRQKVVDDFYNFANGDQALVDKWFKAQALSELESSLDTVKDLMKHKDFVLSNPNRFNSLVTVFAYGENFHLDNGEGYKFLTDAILAVDPVNPHVSARCCTKLLKFAMLEPKRSALMKSQLERVFSTPNISPDLYEIAKKGLEFS